MCYKPKHARVQTNHYWSLFCMNVLIFNKNFGCICSYKDERGLYGLFLIIIIVHKTNRAQLDNYYNDVKQLRDETWYCQTHSISILNWKKLLTRNGRV